jgi:hypothetical protein
MRFWSILDPTAVVALFEGDPAVSLVLVAAFTASGVRSHCLKIDRHSKSVRVAAFRGDDLHFVAKLVRRDQADSDPPNQRPPGRRSRPSIPLMRLANPLEVSYELVLSKTNSIVRNDYLVSAGFDVDLDPLGVGVIRIVHELLQAGGG